MTAVDHFAARALHSGCERPESEGLAAWELARRARMGAGLLGGESALTVLPSGRAPSAEVCRREAGLGRRSRRMHS